MQLSTLVHELTQSGVAARDFEFTRQIRAASSKAAPLIAEGFIRFTTPQSVHYLRMARAETGEVQTHLEQARRKGYFTPEQQAQLVTLANRTMGTITNLLKAKLKQLANSAR